MVKCSGNWPDIIYTGPQTGVDQISSSKSRFNGLSKQHSGGKPLKRLKKARRATYTGLKPGVTESKDSLNCARQRSRIPQTARFFETNSSRRRTYLENG
jgi:hypothetical protein